MTYMKGDSIDYFIEDCRPGGATVGNIVAARNGTILKCGPKKFNANRLRRKRYGCILIRKGSWRAIPAAEPDIICRSVGSATARVHHDRSLRGST